MSRSYAALAATAMLGLAVPAAAQDHAMQGMPGMNMPGMTMPAPTKKKAVTKPAAKRKQAARTVRAKSTHPEPAPAGMQGIDHAAMLGMDNSAMPGMTKPGSGEQAAPGGQSMPDMPLMPGNAQSDHAMPGMSGMSGMSGMAMGGMAQTGTALPAGNAPAPPVPTDHAADNIYGADAMMMGRHHLYEHHGGGNFSQVMLNLAEYQFRNGRDGYRWDGEAWYGGDINRLFLKSEGEGAFREGIESAEVQALYSRAVGPYFNLQGGVRQDLGPSPKRTYATIGFEGLAPGQFEVEGAAFLSNKGDLLARLEGYYDQRITQRLILQPRVELNFAVQDVPENRIGSGLSNAELGLRLRYEIRREFAPYVGVSWDRKTGDTARFVRAPGDDASSRSIVAGVRVWF